ncbi:MAG: hypothetical protein J0I54_09485 [Bosea sp.]|uniref:DUF2336 domain-containing protein n=1 Tax=unclassified Bosea (in: a-proteobacteria) TaxID=2653178 RepID=UPI00095E523B|nr:MULTISPECIES: hypothetical protein [unclassified Bosea (in: a-proteobacteria)]MBN9456846.1 hypothetical protein [Bosea sp. (in: a-proteobacteria)]OJV09045.1 MAG: hypothetical protein BGO20_22665 [Bosea sp. 67-29]
MTKPDTTELAHLARLARDGGLDLSQVSLRVKADLLLSAQQPPIDDLRAFAEMATALVPTIDEATALILARKLAGWRHTPPPVLLALRDRGGAVFAEMVRHGLPLGTGEIEELAETGDDMLLAALASRPDLTSVATLMLVDRDLESLDLALIANIEAPLPRPAAAILIARARSRAAYQPGLLGRPDLSNLELAPLFLRAGPERRLTIIDSLSAYEALHPGERTLPLATTALVEWLDLASEDRSRAFEAIARFHGGDEAFARAMEDDAGRELAALSLVASGTTVEEATRFLIRLGDETARSVERIFALVALMRATRPVIARRLIQHIAGLTPAAAQRRGQHQPVMDPSGTPSRAGTGAARPDSQPAMSDVLGRVGLQRERG